MISEYDLDAISADSLAYDSSYFESDYPTILPLTASDLSLAVSFLKIFRLKILPVSYLVDSNPAFSGTEAPSKDFDSRDSDFFLLAASGSITYSLANYLVVSL